MSLRQQVSTLWVNVAVTGITPQEILAPLTGYQYTITQIAQHERNGNIRDAIMKFGGDEFFRYTLGASGTVVWDKYLPQDLPIGSGFYSLLDFPGRVDTLVKYAIRDVRIPTNLDPLTFVNRPVHTPNSRGQQ